MRASRREQRLRVTSMALRRRPSVPRRSNSAQPVPNLGRELRPAQDSCTPMVRQRHHRGVRAPHTTIKRPRAHKKIGLIWSRMRCERRCAENICLRSHTSRGATYQSVLMNASISLRKAISTGTPSSAVVASLRAAPASPDLASALA